MPRRLTDENIPRQIIALLRARGFDTADIRERGMAGISDGKVFALAQQEERVLITTDRDFSNVILYPPASHHGIIVLRMSKPTGAGFTALFRAFLSSADLEALSRTLTIVPDHKIRQRRPS